MKNQRGFTLLETLITVACLAIIAIPIAGITISSMRNQQTAQDQTEIQQVAEELTQQLNRDFRSARDILDPQPKSLTLQIGQRYVHYLLQDGLSRWESDTPNAPAQDPTVFHVNGGTFVYLNSQEKAATSSDEIASVTLAGLKVEGSEYSVTIPALTVASRYAVLKGFAQVTLPMDPAIWHKDQSHKSLHLTLRNNTDRNLRFTTFNLDDSKNGPLMSILSPTGSETALWTAESKKDYDFGTEENLDQPMTIGKGQSLSFELLFQSNASHNADFSLKLSNPTEGYFTTLSITL